jgi:hypothetical protein
MSKPPKKLAISGVCGSLQSGGYLLRGPHTCDLMPPTAFHANLMRLNGLRPRNQR